METPQLLLVDDSQFARLTIEFLLKLYNIKKYEVKSASSLQECLEFIKENSTKLVLLDLNLKDSNAQRTIAAIPEIVEYAPVVIISGTEDIDIQDQCKKAGASHFIHKSWITLEHKEKLHSIIDFYMR